MQLSQTQKPFPQFFLHFSNLDQILNIFKKKLTLIDMVLPKLRTPKTWLDKCLKSPALQEPS